MVDVLDAFEPGHLRVVNVMRLVVEYRQLVNLAHDFAEIGLAVGGLACGLGAEWIEEIIAQIFIVQRRLTHIAEIDAVNVGKEKIARIPHHAHIVLNVQRELKVVAPVASFVAIVGKNGVVEKNMQAVEIGAQPIKDDDVGRDQQEVARERRIGFVKLVKKTPCDEQRQYFCFTCAGGHLHDVARPVFVEHAC